MKLKNLAFFGVMASILSVASAQAAEGDNYIASKGYVDNKVSTVSTNLGNNYYTKSAMDTELAKKANSADLGTLAAKNTVATADIDNGAVTAEKLATAVQTTINGAVQSVASGTENGTIAVDGTDVAVTGLGTAAYTASTAYDAAGAANTAEQNAKDYADGKFATTTTMNTALADKADTSYVNTELAKKQNTLTFDATPTANSTNPVTSGGVQAAIAALPQADNTYTKAEVNAELAKKQNTIDAENPLPAANVDGLATVATSGKSSDLNNDAGFITKAVSDLTNYTTTTAMNAALNAKADKSTTYTKDEVDTALADKLDTATAVSTYATQTALTEGLATKQNTLTFDATPTADSSNPVTSAGVKAAIDAAKTAAQTIAEATQSATGNQVVTGVTTENGSVKSVTSTLIADANVSDTANVAPSKLNLSQSDCPNGRTCLLTYNASGNYEATPITNDSDLQ